MSIGRRPVLAHAATVLVTLILVAVLFGDRLGLRRPPLAQIRGPIERSWSPLPRGRSRRRPAPSPNRTPEPWARASDPPAAGRRAQGPRPRRAEQYPGLRRGEQERRQHHHRGRRARLLRRRDLHRHRLGLRHRQAGPYPDQFPRHPGGPIRSRSSSSTARRTTPGSSAPTRPTTWPCCRSRCRPRSSFR